jgi:hypothetical protein
MALAFDNVLRLFDLLQDEFFNSIEKVDISLEMLLLEQYTWIEKKPLEERFALFKYILREFIDIDLDEEPQQEKEEEQQEAPPIKSYDFVQDAGIIYASFFHAYNLDLFEQQGKLHWKKFLQLLINLDDKSKFKEVIHIRTMKPPKADKHNAEHRAEIMKAKRFYALKDNRSEAEQAKDMEQKLDALAKAFKPK